MQEMRPEVEATEAGAATDPMDTITEDTDMEGTEAGTGQSAGAPIESMQTEVRLRPAVVVTGGPIKKSGAVLRGLPSWTGVLNLGNIIAGAAAC